MVWVPVVLQEHVPAAPPRWCSRQGFSTKVVDSSYQPVKEASLRRGLGGSEAGLSLTLQICRLMRYCKKCKVEFDGSACPAKHPKFMYSASAKAPEPEPEPEPASYRQPTAVAAAPPAREPNAPSEDLLKAFVKPLKAAMAADKLVKRGDSDQIPAAVSSYEKALNLMVAITTSDDYDRKDREKIEQKVAVVRKRLAKLVPGLPSAPFAVDTGTTLGESTAFSVAAPTPAPLIEPPPEPATTPESSPAPAPVQPPPSPLAPPVPAPDPAHPEWTADDSLLRQHQHLGDETQTVRVLRERLAVAEHEAEKAQMQLAGAAQNASLAEQEARIQLAATRAEASEARQKAIAAEEKLRAELLVQRQRAEKAEDTIEEMRAGIALPEMAQHAIEETSRQAQEQLHAAEDVAREQGRRRATEVTNLAAAVSDFAKLAEDAEARAQQAEKRMAAAVNRAEESISKQLESREAMESKYDTAQQENRNLRGLLNALRETVVQEQAAARVAESTAAAATAEMASEKQAWVSREAQWRTDLNKMDAARRAAESTVKVLSSTRMMMPGQINWPQRIIDAVVEKEQRIVELEMQLDEAWGTIQDMVARSDRVTNTVDEEVTSVSAARSSETDTDHAAQVQLRTLASALRRMQRELGQERAAREKAEADLRNSPTP